MKKPTERFRRAAYQARPASSCTPTNTSAFRALIHIAREWLYGDRVRVSPEAGKLLRLRRGSVIIVGAHKAIVAQRLPVQDEPSRVIHYGCRTSDGEAFLQVFYDSEGNVESVCWRTDDRDFQLTIDDVRVYR